MPRAELQKERVCRIGTPYPGGESYSDVVARVSAFLDELASEHDRERVVVIGHAATRWALQHLLEGTPLEELVSAPFDWQEGWIFEMRRE
jgi:broad specificity phosphatase PhoE